MDHIGFIGLGVMGEPMCRNLARKSAARVVAFDLRAEPLERLAAHGVLTADGVAQVAAQASVILLSLPGGPQLQAVCEQLLPLLEPGQTVVDTGTSAQGF